MEAIGIVALVLHGVGAVTFFGVFLRWHRKKHAGRIADEIRELAGAASLALLWPFMVIVCVWVDPE